MEDICEKLIEWGLNQTYLGYDYIVFGVGFILEAGKAVQMKVLYTEAARRFSTSAKCVERDMRTAFQVLWREEAFCRFLHGELAKKKPGNAQLLHLLAWYWRK